MLLLYIIIIITVIIITIIIISIIIIINIIIIYIYTAKNEQCDFGFVGKCATSIQ